jgi:hypothetical protein
LLLASELLDVLSFGFVAVGIESTGSYQINLSQGLLVIRSASSPWSHGLLMALIWFTIALVLGRFIFKEWRVGAVLGLAVFSHWALDFIVHISDLPLLLGGSQTVGLGLWSTGPGLIAAMVLEFALLGAGLITYFTWRRRLHNIATSPARPEQRTKPLEMLG